MKLESKVKHFEDMREFLEEVIAEAVERAISNKTDYNLTISLKNGSQITFEDGDSPIFFEIDGEEFMKIAIAKDKKIYYISLHNISHIHESIVD